LYSAPAVAANHSSTVDSTLTPVSAVGIAGVAAVVVSFAAAVVVVVAVAVSLLAASAAALALPIAPLHSDRHYPMYMAALHNHYAHKHTIHVHTNNHHTTATQDPAFFIHRVGRAARAGRRGQSLTLLSPEEDAYIEFLALRRVPLTEVPHSWDFAAVARTASTSGTTTADTAADNDADIDAAAGADFESEAESDNEGDDVSDDVSMSDSPEGELPQGGADVSAMSAEDAAVAEQDEAVLQRARQLVRTDRDLLEKGTRAFVAFVRAYKVSHSHRFTA
jgi:hypothetical protein